MIKENELRIGNWFIGGWKGDSYLQVTAGYLCSWFGGGMCGSFPEPNFIPLTPEILEKCGFEGPSGEEKQFPMCDPKNKFKFDIWKIPMGDFYYSHKEGLYVGSFFHTFLAIHNEPLKHLHQFQNLYFVLTGEELEIKL